MEDEIVNRVAQSALVTFDLEELYPSGVFLEVDLSQWLDQGFILREKEFRNAIKKHDWDQYSGNYIALNCKTDAILPAWASLLVTSQLSKVAEQIVWGTIKDLEKQLFSQAITNLDLTSFEGKPVMLKVVLKKKFQRLHLWNSFKSFNLLLKVCFMGRPVRQSLFIKARL